jgi:hypothetical protein
VHLPVSADRGLGRRALASAREQEDIHRRPIPRAGNRRRLLLLDSGEPKGAGQASPGAVSRVEVIGHVHHRDPSAPKRIGHGD